MRIFAVSDLHVHYSENMRWLENLSPTDYAADVLILAGDVSEKMNILESAFRILQERFDHLFFVPGNHDLWLSEEDLPDSFVKFQRILDLCNTIGVKTRPMRVGEHNGVWIVPLFSWYVKPEEGEDTLFIPKMGESLSLIAWGDSYFTKWPSLDEKGTVADVFLPLNKEHLQGPYDAPIISFSHFLPRKELIHNTPIENEEDGDFIDPNPRFNFSRVAGSSGLERQIRQLGSVIHIYGHQHRNRHRIIDGVKYISHCLGYPQERERDQIVGVEDGPRLIWDTAYDIFANR